MSEPPRTPGGPSAAAVAFESGGVTGMRQRSPSRGYRQPDPLLSAHIRPRASTSTVIVTQPVCDLFLTRKDRVLLTCSNCSLNSLCRPSRSTVVRWRLPRSSLS